MRVFDLALAHRAQPHGHGVLRGADEDAQGIDLRAQGGDHLLAGRAGTDHGHALAGHVEVLGPGGGVDQPALEVVTSRDVRHVDGREQSHGIDDVGGTDRGAVVRGQDPLVCFLVKALSGHPHVEAEVTAQVEPVDDALQVGQDLRLRQVGVLPDGVLVQVLVEGVLVDVALGVRQSTGVAVPVPSAARSSRPVEADGRQAQFVDQFVHGVDAAESGSDDDGVNSLVSTHGILLCAVASWSPACVTLTTPDKDSME